MPQNVPKFKAHKLQNTFLNKCFSGTLSEDSGAIIICNNLEDLNVH